MFLASFPGSKYLVPSLRTIESFRRLFVSFLMKLFFQTHWYVESMCYKVELLEVNCTACSQAREEDGKPPSKDVIEAMA